MNNKQEVKEEIENALRDEYIALDFVCKELMRENKKLDRIDRYHHKQRLKGATGDRLRKITIEQLEDQFRKRANSKALVILTNRIRELERLGIHPGFFLPEELRQAKLLRDLGELPESEPAEYHRTPKH